MKRILIITFLIALVLNNISVQSQVQLGDPKYGPDTTSREKCLKHLAILQDNMKVDNYEGSINSWRHVVNNCPASTKNIYINGVKILTYFLKKSYKEKNSEAFNAYVDTLMFLYDKRIENFGQKGFVRGRQGVDLLNFRKDDFEKAYGYLKESVELKKTSSEDAVLITFMQATVGMFKNGKIDEEMVMENFQLISQHLEYRMNNPRRGQASYAEKSKKALEGVEKLYKESGAATCEALVKSFTPKYEADPDNLDLLKKITGYLNDIDCTDSELYSKTAEKLYALEPSPDAAANLARYFYKKENYDKSLDYFNKTIDTEPDAVAKAEYLFQKANILFLLKQYSQARAAAFEAAKNNPKWGKPYILVGTMYASSNQMCASDKNIDASAVFWVAVDMFAKAKAVDPDVADEATDLINKFAPYYPNKEEAFFHNVKEGDTYKVGCWINTSTKARFSK